jgi:hypothetical protein
MSTELTAATLRELSIPERKELIYNQSLKIDVTDIRDEELHKAYKLAKVIYPILASYFQNH